MVIASSYGTSGFSMPFVSKYIVFLSKSLTSAPISRRIFMHLVISLISGTFSRTHGSSHRIVAATNATAAFFAPLICTVPCNGLPPCITNFSKFTHSLTRLSASLSADAQIIPQPQAK